MKSRFGFTMIEILIALVILSFGFLPIYNLFRQGSATTVNNIQENIATNYASDMINFCKDLKFTKINDADNRTDIPLEDDVKIHDFFSQEKIKVEPPTAVEKPFARSMHLHKVDTRTFWSGLITGGIAAIKERREDRKKNRKAVPAYIVTVTVTFPRMSGKGEDEVTLYSLIMD